MARLDLQHGQISECQSRGSFMDKEVHKHWDAWATRPVSRYPLAGDVAETDDVEVEEVWGEGKEQKACDSFGLISPFILS